MCPIFTYEYWNKRTNAKPPSPSLTFSFLTEFFFQTLKSCFFQHFQLSKRQTQRVEEESSCSTIKTWYNEPRYSELNPAPILRIYNAHYIWCSELFDIVNKKGLTDLFVISRFECSRGLKVAFLRSSQDWIQL